METHKDLSVGPIIAGVLLVVIAVAVFIILPNMLQPTTSLRLGDGVFRARIALNESDRTKGLSGVTNMNADQALVMAFPSSSKWQIWMKDMKVPIDIIWLDVNKKIVYIVKNASPVDSDSKIFEPKTSAKYVIELPAGSVDAKSIKTDSTAVFEINDSDIK